MTTKDRLTKLEQLAERASADLVTIILEDGERRTVQLVDCISLLMDGTPIADIQGEVSSGNGMLLDLLRGMIEQPEDTDFFEEWGLEKS